MRNKLTLKWVVWLLLFFSANLSLAQTNYYVDPSIGSDGNSGLSGFPKATVQAAITAAVTPAVINIAAGTYTENVVIDKGDITLKGAGAGTHENSAPDAVNPAVHTVFSNATGIGITISGAQTNVKITDLIVQGYGDGGIRAGTAGCNNFTAERLQVLSCGGQAGLLITGDVNGVTINDVASMNNVGRAIVVWDRYKQNISITNCYAVLGGIAGIELQDGTASGVYIANNTIIGGAVGDSGMGLSGLKGGAGPNIIENNTITMSKRYGIELKNPAGTGTETDTEDGAIIVRNNNIVRTGALTDVRDLAGIAVFRRAILENNSYNNIDVPSGVVIVDNTIDGFVQSDAGIGNDGFGVVVEGVRMTVKNNSISNCDIGVQRQSGNSSGYVKDDKGDALQEANDTYFNRGNSPFSSAINVSGNTFSGNTSDTRDVFAPSTYFSDTQYVINTDQLNAFATIGLAVEYADAGNTLKLAANTFEERVVINKKLTIKGPNFGVEGKNSRVTEAKIIPPTTDLAVTSLPLVKFIAGSEGSVFDGIEVNGDNPALSTSGITSGGVIVDAAYGISIDNVGEITVQNNIIQNFGSTEATPTAFLIGAETASTAISNILITRNLLKNLNQSTPFASMDAVAITNSVYAQITNNKFEDVRGGIQFVNGYQPNPLEGTFDAIIADNDISSYRIGLYYNLQYLNASPWKVENNTFQSITPIGGNTKYEAIRVESIQGAVAGNITGNTVNGNVADRVSENPSFNVFGISFNNNVNSTGLFLVKDNDISNVQHGITFIAEGTTTLTTDVRFIGGNIHDVTGDYVHYEITSGTPTFADANFPSTQLDGKTGEEYTPLELAGIFATKITDKEDNANLGKVSFLFPVKNITQGTAFSDIQAAIDDIITQNGDVINVDAGTYTLTSGINVNKELTIRGNNNDLLNKPLVNGTGEITHKSLFYVDAPNVTIQNFHIQFAEQNADLGSSVSSYGIRASETFDNLKVLDNLIEGTGTSYVFNSYGIFLGVQTPASDPAMVTIQRNKIAHTQANNALGRGIRTWFVNGTIGGSLADQNDIKAFYASVDLSVSGGANPINVSYNNLSGKLVIGGLKPGNHNVSYNTITSGGTADASAHGAGDVGADLQPALIEVVSSRTDLANLEISNNTLTDFKYIGIALFASSNVSVLNNTLTPLANETGFTHVLFETKTTDSNSESAKALKNIIIKGNSFNSSGVAGGTGLYFANSNGSSSLEPLSLSTIGGAGADANTFSSDLASYVELDQQSGLSNAIPLWVTQFYSGTVVTDVIPFTSNIDIAQNKIGASDLSSFTDADFYSLEAKITHGLDNGTTGFVTVKPNYAYTASASETENAMKIVPDGYTVLVKSGTDLSAATLLSKHSLTLSSEDANLTVGSIGIDADGKAVTLDKPTVATSLDLSAGKVVTTATNTLTVPASGISFTSGIGNFVDGPLNVTSVNADQVIPVGKGTKAAYIGLSGVANGPSNFTAEYFFSAYTDVTNKEASMESVSSNEYWLLDRTSGTLTGNVQLYSFDQAASGLTDFTPDHALVAWYSGGEWKNQGNGAFTTNNITASLGNSSFGAFTFASAEDVLPVELLSFNAVAKTQGALLSWSTASEKDNDHFEIQKSTDGVSFFKLADVTAGANAGQPQSYQYLDISFRQSSYYQLVQVNKDGTRKVYSNNIKYVSGLGGALVVSVYPNPVTASLHVVYKSETPENISGRLTDYLGKTIKTFAGNSKSDIVLDLSKEQPGIYILKTETSQGLKTTKIIKQ